MQPKITHKTEAFRMDNVQTGEAIVTYKVVYADKTEEYRVEINGKDSGKSFAFIHEASLFTLQSVQ